jgi:hypothetical protein
VFRLVKQVDHSSALDLEQWPCCRA